MKAIVGKNAHEIAPRLLAFLSLARQAGLRGDLLRGEAGELCVVPHENEGADLLASSPRHLSEIQLVDDHVEVDGGPKFRVVERREAQGALEIATAVSVASPGLPPWRTRVLFALRDEAVLGRMVRALLERGRDRMSFARVPSGAVHPGTDYLLLVRNAPLYVILEVMEESLGHAFYEASHARERDTPLGLFLPWGFDFPLLAALGSRLDRACVRQVSGRLAALDLDTFSPIDAVLAPELGATARAVAHVPHGELRVPVPLRLVPLDKAQTGEPTELWRVGPELLDQLATELSCAEDRLAGLLAQVVRLGDDTEPSVFIWAPAGGDEDSERLSFTALPGFARARRRLANLLLPARHAMLPTLADETLRQVFGLRQGVLTVVDLAPGAAPTAYRLRVEDFRPLRASLVDYVLHLHERPLVALCETATFDFAPITLGPADETPETPSEAQGQSPARHQARGDDANEDESDGKAQPTPATAESWTVPRAPEAPAPEIHWPTRLEQATQSLIATPADEEPWLDFFQASLALGRRLDAQMALLRLLPTCPPDRARSLLGAALGLRGRAAEHDGLVALAAAEEPVATLASGLEQTLGLAMAALAPLDSLAAGGSSASDIRRGICRLPARVRALGVPRLTWTAARLAFDLTRDTHVLADARLLVEPGLFSLSVREASPTLIAETLEARKAEANRAAVQAFADQAGLGRAERVFLRLAYALRLLVLGGGVDSGLLSELAAELESARPDLGASGDQVGAALRTLDHLRSHSLANLAGFEIDPNLRTVLIEEGYLPPLHESAETHVLRQGAELATAAAADAAQRVVALFDEVASANHGGLDAMFAVTSRLRRAGQRDALVALRERVASANAQAGTTGRTAFVLAGLATGLAAALEPDREPSPSFAELVDRAAGLPMWDLPIGVRTVLSALEPLPVETRRQRAVPLYQALRQRGAIREWSGQRTIRVDEQRALLRLVNLLVVPVDETPEAERLCRAEWTCLRETIRRDLERAQRETS